MCTSCWLSRGFRFKSHFEHKFICFQYPDSNNTLIGVVITTNIGRYVNRKSACKVSKFNAIIKFLGSIWEVKLCQLNWQQKFVWNLQHGSDRMNDDDDDDDFSVFFRQLGNSGSQPSRSLDPGRGQRWGLGAKLSAASQS